MSELQRLTERVGEVLARSVAIDDPNMRLLAYSPHYGAVDEQRLASILKRQANPEAIAWARANGAHTATTWFRLPARDEYGMLGRLCVPIWYQDRRLGYLWIIDPDESLDSGQIAAAEQAAADAATVLFRDSLMNDLERARERELLRDLIDPEESLHGHAIVGLAEDSLFDVARTVTAIVLDSTKVEAGPGDAEAADMALSDVRRVLQARRSLGLVRPDHAVLLVAHDNSTEAITWAHRLQAAYERVAGRGVEQPARVGLGATVNNIEQAHDSYRQAYQAVRIGRTLGLSGVVEWSELGIYRLLAELDIDALGAGAFHPALKRIHENDKTGQLLVTLETYLDLAGDAKATAESLYIHRATLYHRLAKIEALGGADLRKGLNRLDLHLGLKLGHLFGYFRRSEEPPVEIAEEPSLPAEPT